MPHLEPVARASDKEITTPLEHVVLESGPDYIRVLHEARGARLALYAEAEDFREVPIRMVEAAIAEPGSEVDARLVLQPGVLVDWVGDRAGERRARARERDLIDVSGWVRGSDIGRVYTPVAFTRPATTHHLARRVDVHTSERGLPFGTIDAGPDDWVRVQSLGEPRSGRRKVAAFGQRFFVEGWVDERALVADSSQSGRLGGSHSGWGGGPVVYLPPGAALYASHDAEQVGLTTAEVRVRDWSERRAGRRRVSVYTWGWGFIQVWAADEAIERGSREHEASEKRLARVTVKRVSATGGFSDAESTVDYERREIAECIEKVEKDGATVRGQLQLRILVDREGAQESLKVSGAASKDPSFAQCLEAELRIWLTPNELRPRPGTLEATIEIGAP